MTEQPEPRSLQLAHDIIQAEHEHGIRSAALVIQRAVEQRVAEALAEREAVIVAWLRSEAQLCDCHAHSSGECACGAWDTEPGERSYKTAYIEDLADAIEAGEHLPKGDEHE